EGGEVDLAPGGRVGPDRGVVDAGEVRGQPDLLARPAHRSSLGVWVPGTGLPGAGAAGTRGPLVGVGLRGGSAGGARGHPALAGRRARDRVPGAGRAVAGWEAEAIAPEGRPHARQSLGAERVTAGRPRAPGRPRRPAIRGAPPAARTGPSAAADACAAGRTRPRPALRRTADRTGPAARAEGAKHRKAPAAPGCGGTGALWAPFRGGRALASVAPAVRAARRGHRGPSPAPRPPGGSRSPRSGSARERGAQETPSSAAAALHCTSGSPPAGVTGAAGSPSGGAR